MNKKVISFILIITGAALLLGAGIFIMDSLTAAEPAGLGKWIFDILGLLLGAGASIKGWLDIFKKDKGASGKTQNNVGDNNTNIQAETVNVYPPAPKESEPHPALGSIPPDRADYVYRGKIEDDVRAALRKGGTSAIVGLHAPGGTGKTEMATRIAQEVKEGKFGFASVLWVDVNEKSPAEVLGEALRKCGIQIQPNASETDKKAEWHYFLENKKLLVIFDDVRANAAHGLKELLPSAPCAALITSRIQQMANVNEFALDHMEPEQARELFVNSLGEDAVKAEEGIVFKLAERCKYNPLALEIASRRIRQNMDFTNPVAKYFEKAEKRFEELKMHGDDRWNLTAVFDLSYNDLSESDRKYFRALAVFAPTGFSPNAAAHVWNMSFDYAQDKVRAERSRSAIEAEGQVSDVLSRFQNLSLIIPVKGDFERFRLHDLLDEYAMLKLNGREAEGDEEKEVKGKLVDWVIGFYNEITIPDMDNLPIGILEKDNLLTACAYACGYKDGNRLAQLSTRTLNWFNTYFYENKSEWLAWLESSLKLGIEDSTDEGKQLKANVLQAIGDVQQFRKETDAAIESYNEALKLFRQVGDKLGEANVYLSLGGAKRTDKEFVGAKIDFENALKTYQIIGDQYSQARAYYRLGDCLSDEEKYKDALIQYEKAVQLWTAIGVTDLVESILKPRIEEAKKHL